MSKGEVEDMETMKKSLQAKVSTVIEDPMASGLVEVFENTENVNLIKHELEVFSKIGEEKKEELPLSPGAYSDTRRKMEI